MKNNHMRIAIVACAAAFAMVQSRTAFSQNAQSTTVKALDSFNINGGTLTYSYTVNSRCPASAHNNSLLISTVNGQNLTNSFVIKIMDSAYESRCGGALNAVVVSGTMNLASAVNSKSREMMNRGYRIDPESTVVLPPVRAAAFANANVSSGYGTYFGWPNGQRPTDLASMQKDAENVCMAMSPYLERPGSVKGVTVVQNDEINAFADQNDKITIYTGMMNFIRDNNDLALVCGHEMSHISAKHIDKSMLSNLLGSVAAAVIGGTPGNAAGSAIISKDSRKHERDADSRGLLYMWKAGFDPRVGWSFWQNLEQKYKQGNGAVTKFFGDHPVNDERVEDMKVLLVRDCKASPDLQYCDSILADKALVDTFNNFQNRK